jgi:energy-coupling factor transporter ATP-binding protein EcfA2
MILHGIQAHNFMSLRDCTIGELDEHLNFFVGPNGSGKTTIFRVLKAVRDTFSFEKTVPFNQLCTRGISPQEIDLTLDVEFNTNWEQELITTFLCATLSRTNDLVNVLSPKLPQSIAPVATEGLGHSQIGSYIYSAQKLFLSYSVANYKYHIEARTTKTLVSLIP